MLHAVMQCASFGSSEPILLCRTTSSGTLTTNHENTMQTENDTSKPEDSPQQEAGEGCPGATCSEFAGIQALIQIREALGDPCGKLMQDELVDKVLNLIQGEKELREGVITYIKDHEDESVDELKYLLDYTQWWDWDFTPPNAGGMAPGSAVPDSESKTKLDR